MNSKECYEIVVDIIDVGMKVKLSNLKVEQIHITNVFATIESFVTKSANFCNINIKIIGLFT